MEPTYVIEFPNGDSFYACAACAALVAKHDTGASNTGTSRSHDCELHYHGVCTDTPKES
jgi:hypothetical protein